MKLNDNGFIENIKFGDKLYLFDGKGPAIYGAKEYGLQASINLTEAEDNLAVNITIENTGNTVITPKRLGIYLGADCCMESFPEWNDKLFPTMMRCEKTHFYGYFISPNGMVLGIASSKPLASYKLLYNDLGHRIYSVELDILNSLAQPSRHADNLKYIKPAEKIERTIYLFPINSLKDFEKTAEKYTAAPVLSAEKYTVELGEAITVYADCDTKISIISPSGRELQNGCTADEYGIYTVKGERNSKRSEALIYCRKNWDFYLKAARKQALEKPQKATTHCESWYGLFSGYLAAKHYPNELLDAEIESTFQNIMPYMFDFKNGEPLLAPYRIQNVSCLISLLADRFELNPEKYIDSLDTAVKFADYLISMQRESGAYYNLGSGAIHYTCVIYIAKSILELYLVEKDIPKYKDCSKKHFNSVKAAIDNLVKNLDNIQTEGEQTFEDGMISCSSLQIGMFALLLDEAARTPYIEAAERMLKKHECLEQKKIPDCRMRNCSLRYWESQYDVLTKPNMMNSPHGWTAWTLYAKYYLYLLTGKAEYLKDLMDGLGACVQLMTLDGELRWGFICDPCVEASVYVPDKQIKNGCSGKYIDKIIGEEYLPMISGWFRHNSQIPTGGYPECPLILKDRCETVDTQGGCCDNDVHEIFKCLEETVLKKAFIHELENGSYLCYSCRIENGSLLLNEDADTVICYCLHNSISINLNNKKVLLSTTPGKVSVYKHLENSTSPMYRTTPIYPIKPYKQPKEK